MIRTVLVAATLLIVGAPVSAGPGDLFEEKVKDFGTSARGSVLVHYFRFTNTTKQTLTLGQPRVSCGCVSASISKSRVAPGEDAAVIAHMDTRRIPTPNVTKAVTVYVPFLSPSQEEVSLRVQTVCRDDLLLSPTSLAFGTVRNGAEGTASTRVTFLSDPNWEVIESKCTGGYVDAKHKLVSREGSSVTYEVTAVLDPECPVGNWTCDICLKTSNKSVESLRIPVTVNVAATVIPAGAKSTAKSAAP
jgi:hypothetical protein